VRILLLQKQKIVRQLIFHVYAEIFNIIFRSRVNGSNTKSLWQGYHIYKPNFLKILFKASPYGNAAADSDK
jgi:hypothetical protein